MSDEMMPFRFKFEVNKRVRVNLKDSIGKIDGTGRVVGAVAPPFPFAPIGWIVLFDDPKAAGFPDRYPFPAAVFLEDELTIVPDDVAENGV